MRNIRRGFAVALVLLPLLVGCKVVRQYQKGVHLSDAQSRFEGVGAVLVTDAVPGAEMLGVEFFADDHALPFYAKSVLTRRTREIMSYPGDRVPDRVRIVWRKTHETYRARGRIRYGGEIAGDYVIPVAARIPLGLLQEIRAKGGSLRLKFRLKPDGVLFGWDIERAPEDKRNYSREDILGGNLYFPSEYFMIGGDFLETRY